MADPILNATFLFGLLAATLRQATPLLFAATGEIWSERAGVLNVGLEGYMLIGALTGFLGAYYAGDNAWIGLMASIASGSLISLGLAVMTVRLGVDQVVTGIAFNMAALGFTSFMYQRLLAGSMVPPSITGFPSVAGLDPLVPVGLLLVPVSSILLHRTHLGLSVKAVGEHPMAAEFNGISVLGTRMIGAVLAGTFASIGGACLSLGQVHLFLENMTAGRGFIVLAIVVFSGWSPWKAMGVCALFGLADGLQLRMQALRVPLPRELLMMLPYVLCVLVLAARATRHRPPGGLAVPYLKEASEG